MKIDRRSFLSFVVGGAAGTALSPLPWKLTDDLSIWTQNWPWTPVPARGETTYENSACGLCPGGCGISVRKIDERAVKIEGMEGHPVNDGGMCILGMAGLQMLYGPTRVASPMKKENGAWKKISWDDAIAEITEKLAALRSEGKAASVACVSGSGKGTVPALLKRFLTAYGSPNFMTMPCVGDAGAIVLKKTQGVEGCVGFDLENADFVLSFGTGLIEGWGSPVAAIRANSALKDRKAKVVQIESRLSNTAAKADQWVPVNPGTEAVLAMGLANLIIAGDLYNKDFVANSEGFDGFKAIVEAYPPEKVAEITGVDAETLKSLAQGFAKAAAPVALCGKGKGNTPGSLKEFMAVYALNALKGNINQAGGAWNVPPADYIAWPEPELDEVAQKGMETPRIDGAGSETYPDAASLLTRVPQIINAAEASPVEVLFVSGANPYFGLPGANAAKTALSRIPLKISFSSYMDETAAASDYILPNHTYLERYEDVPAPAGTKSVITLSKPVVAPLCDTKNTGDAVLMMAKALGDSVAGAFPWDSYEACLQETLGDNWDALTESGFVATDVTPAAAETFAFPTKECETVAIEGDDKAFPLVLLPYDSMRIASGYVANPPFLTKSVSDKTLKGKDICVEINPKSAKWLKDGDYAVLVTPRGKKKVRVSLCEGVMPGVVAMARGLGHTAYDDYLAGKGVNVNELIGPVEDPTTGLDAAWGIRAKLTQA